MASGWAATGKTLGVAVDLDAGRMLVRVNGAAWADAFSAACAPSAVAGAGLFPALSGGMGMRVRCNWGVDAARPMKHGAPAGGYRAVGLALHQAVPLPTDPHHHTRHATATPGPRHANPQQLGSAAGGHHPGWSGLAPPHVAHVPACVTSSRDRMHQVT